MHNHAIKTNQDTQLSINSFDSAVAPMGCRNNAGVDGHTLALVLANADIIIELTDGMCGLRISREAATRLAFSGSWKNGIKALCDLIIIWDDNRCAVINVLQTVNNISSRH